MKNTLQAIVRLLKTSPLEMAVIAGLVVSLSSVALPASADVLSKTSAEEKAVALKVAAMQNQTKEYGAFPAADMRGPSYTIRVPATAYTSRPEETDSTPFTTASGSTVHVGTLAANFLPMGTRVKIPDYFGDQIFVVEDRMNPRYHQRVDIWMEDLGDARKFGVRNVTLEIYPAK